MRLGPRYVLPARRDAEVSPTLIVDLGIRPSLRLLDQPMLREPAYAAV
jgi:hypothetical protein